MPLQKSAKIVSLFLGLAFAVPAYSALGPALTESVPTKTEDVRVSQLLLRLETIKSMDKSGMTKSERKALRKEVISIKKELKAIKGGVYLSVAAIIIIVLLLVLIL